MAAVLLGLLVIAYMPALNGGMIWDDDAHLTKPTLQGIDGLWQIWTKLGATQQYYPLLHTAFWLEHQMWGDSLLGYHLATLSFHFFAALLLVALLKRLAIPGAWLAAFLFALHPVNVESVAWISEQKNTLSAVFYFGSALYYLEFDRTKERKPYWIGFALFAAALATKSVTAMLPAGLLVVLWWRNGTANLRRDVLHLTPWFAAGSAAGLFTSWVERTYIGAKGTHYALGLMDRCLLAGRIVWFYIAKLVWPVNLTFVYPHWSIGPNSIGQLAFPVCALLAVGVLVYVARRNRAPLAGYLFFLVTLFPAIGFLNVYPFRFSYVADHFQYLACLGILVPLAAGLTIFSSKITPTQRKAATAGLVGVLFVLTWLQSAMYRDAYTLYSQTVVRSPDAWMAHNGLGLILGRYPNRSNEAIQHLEIAKQLQPDSSEIHNNLGVILSNTPGRMEEAAGEFRAALAVRPDWAVAHNNLGSALADLPGRKAEAIAEYEAALRIDPRYAEAHNNLGSTLSEQSERLPEAIQHFEEALRWNPGMAEAHANLGVALARTQGRLPDAAKHLQAALALRPDMQQVRQLLLRVLEQLQ